MTDDQILDVITQWGYDTSWDWDMRAGILAALRDAGCDVVPTDIAKLGRAVERYATTNNRTVHDIYAEAGVERP